MDRKWKLKSETEFTQWATPRKPYGGEEAFATAGEWSDKYEIRAKKAESDLISLLDEMQRELDFLNAAKDIIITDGVALQERITKLTNILNQYRHE